MKLAFIASPEKPVPPEDYGGGERTIDIMVRSLVKRGHKVDLYCKVGSTCPATKRIETKGGKGAEIEQYKKVKESVDKYDCIIDHGPNHIVGQDIKVKNELSIMGGDPLKRYPHDQVKNRVYKSKEFAFFCMFPNHPVLPSVVENNPKKIPFFPKPQQEYPYALYVGSIRPIKGVHVAAEACKMLGMKLKVAGPIQDKKYWESFRNSVEYIGMLGKEKRDETFGKATAFLHPVQVCDCNPNAPKEAMLRGTPVVCCPMGGIVGFMQPGIGGYFAQSPVDFTRGIVTAGLLDRELVRKSILRQVDPDYCVDVLVDLCKRVAGGQTW